MSAKPAYPDPDLRQRIMKELGWRAWSLDPWGNLDTFDAWQKIAPAETLSAHTVNGIRRGREYLYDKCFRVLLRFPWRQQSPASLIEILQTGEQLKLIIRAIEDDPIRFPAKPLPPSYVDALQNSEPDPFSAYWLSVLHITAARMALMVDLRCYRSSALPSTSPLRKVTPLRTESAMGFWS